MHDFGFAHDLRDVCAAVHRDLGRKYRLGQRFFLVGIFEGSAHAESFSQVKWTVCVIGVQVAYSTSRPMASDDELTMAGRMCQALVVTKRDRGPSEARVENVPSLLDDASSLHAVSLTSSARCCGSYAAWCVYDRLVEMQSDCDGASRMRSCRGGGGDDGAGVSAKPCLRWALFARLDNGRLWKHLDCDDACDLCSSFSRASALLCVWLTSEYWSRVYAWRCPSQRATQVTTFVVRAHAGDLYFGP